MSECSPVCPNLGEQTLDQTEIIVLPESQINRRLDLEFADTAAKPVPEKGGTTDPANDHMKVYLRIRPLSEQEENKDEDQKCFEVGENHRVVLAHAPKDSHTYKSSKHGLSKSTHKFTFSHIFSSQTTQKEFFDETMLATVKDFVNGQNCLVFTYGVTNSGKTYTIQGNPKDGGILPRALDVIFNSIDGKQWNGLSLKPQMFCDVKRLTLKQEELEMKAKESLLKLATEDEADMGCLLDDDTSRSTASSTMSEDSLMVQRNSSGGPPDKDAVESMIEELDSRVREDAVINVESQGQIRFSIWVSFLELYNEQVFDLLEPLPKKKNARRVVLQLREDKRGIPYVKGLREIQVSSADEAYKLLTVGQKNLQVACTKLNHQSSRSHCIFTIKMLRVVDKEDPHVARISMLSLCDLAGSERWTKTQSMGDRVKEAANINTSLLTLGKCIKTLRHNQLYRENPQIVPFRESKMTRIFQSFFSGKGKASMIVNINQCASMFDETLHALKYSAVAKQVIVTQEEPKPMPQKKERRPPRFVSLALMQDNSNRMSIPWATPRTLQQLSVLEESAICSELPEGDDVFDETLNVDREQELLEVIEKLKAALKEDKMKAFKLECKIREEVTNEMAQQLIQIENNYSELLKDERARAEERAEKRVEMYIQSVRKKSNKRKRVEDDHDIETVPASQLITLQSQLQNKEGIIVDLQDRLQNFDSEIQQLQMSLKAAIREKEDAIQETSKLKFDIAALKNDLEKYAQQSGNTSAAADLGEGQVVASLTQQIDALRQDLAKKAEMNKELSDMLTEAGETFEDNQTRIQQLEALVAKYEQQLNKDIGMRQTDTRQYTSISSGIESDASEIYQSHKVTSKIVCDKPVFRQAAPPVDLEPHVIQLDRSPGVIHDTVSSPKYRKCDSPGNDLASETFSAFNPAASSTMHGGLDQTELVSVQLVAKADQMLNKENIKNKSHQNVVKMVKKVFSPKPKALVAPSEDISNFKHPNSPKPINKSVANGNAAAGSKFIAKHTMSSRLRMVQTTTAAPKPSKRQCTDGEMNTSIVSKMRRAIKDGFGGRKNARRKSQDRRKSRDRRRSSLGGVRTRSQLRK